MCESPLSQTLAAPVEIAASGAEQFTFSTATLLLMMTIVAIVAGIAANYPGTAIVMGVVLLPICIKTVRLVRQRERGGHHVSTLAKASLIAVSFLTVVTFFMLACCAAFCSFCGVCLLIAATETESRDFSRGGTLGLMLTLFGAALVTATWKMRSWMKRKRDAGELPI